MGQHYCPYGVVLRIQQQKKHVKCRTGARIVAAATKTIRRAYMTREGTHLTSAYAHTVFRSANDVMKRESRPKPLARCAAFREQVPGSHGSGRGLSWQQLFLPLVVEPLTLLFMTDVTPHRFPRGIQTLHVNDTWPPKSPRDRPLAAPTGAPRFSFQSHAMQSTWPGRILPVTCSRTRVPLSVVTPTSNMSATLWLLGTRQGQCDHSTRASQSARPQCPLHSAPTSTDTHRRPPP